MWSFETSSAKISFYFGDWWVNKMEKLKHHCSYGRLSSVVLALHNLYAQMLNTQCSWKFISNALSVISNSNIVLLLNFGSCCFLFRCIVSICDAKTSIYSRYTPTRSILNTSLVYPICNLTTKLLDCNVHIFTSYYHRSKALSVIRLESVIYLYFRGLSHSVHNYINVSCHFFNLPDWS